MNNLRKMHEQSFDWLSWKNGSLLRIFNIKHRAKYISLNKEIIREYAIGFCKADNIPCRPKKDYIAVMFFNDKGDWFTHFTKKEFDICFPEHSRDI